MATYVNNLRLKEITTGDEDGTWGTSTNTNLELITDGFSYGTKEIAADANETFTMPDATADATRSLYLKFTSAVSLTATREITLGPNTVSKTWIIENATSGSQIITIKQGSGATVDVANGAKVMIVTDGAGAGAAVFNANPTEVGGTVTSVGGTGTINGITLTGTVTSSGDLTLGGTFTATVSEISDLTATAAEINILDGATVSTAEINYLDITTLGTSEASKVVTADANGDVLVSEEFKAKSYNETYVAMGANDVDCETGNFFSKTISANTTFTFSNPPASGTAFGFVLELTVSGTRTVTWPTSVDWAGGITPNAPADGETDIFCFLTRDGGTTWYGFLGGDAVA